ncbi:hypothetical protein DFQ28_005708 [Apophysomyces sp. BC1034]|nr:hypothetical protein DFQ30_005691 [Apophysomyces sp. BC1015]KAG0177511.1 hypothetical protein DFQ29_004764 [Apophysomyces sp. BC1021]KAG0187874.1 hypothetical protein DFQ28_005708 [Apophysomyces sp. BC1034]
MQIKNARAALISNYEVLKLLEEQQHIQKAAQIANPDIEYSEHLRTIQFELTEHLKTTPSGTQAPEQLRQYLDRIASFKLTRAEKLQILNLRPKSAVEIYLLIEECEERFSEDDLGDMLNIVLETLPRDDDEVKEEEEEERGGEGLDEMEQDE